MKKFGPACLPHLLALVALTTPSLAKEEWRALGSPHFEVISQTPYLHGTGKAGGVEEGLARRALLKLEETRALVGQAFPGWRVDPAQPVVVVLFRDQLSMRPYQVGPKGVNGYFLPGDDRPYIVLSGPAEGSEASGFDRPLSHAELRLILSLNYAIVPAWLEQGLADFFVAADPESRPEASGVGTGRPGEAVLGNPPADYLATLREKKPIPLAEFLNAARDSKYFTEPESSSIYRAQAWATVHYLMLGEANRRGASELAKRDSKQAIPAFLELLGQGVQQAVALAQATGMDLEKLERTVVSPQRNAADYPRPDRIGARTTFALKSVRRERDLRARTLSEAEALYYQGDLLLHLGRYDAARLKLEAALALDPKLRLARVARGLLAVQLNHWVEARRELQEVAEAPESGAPPSGYLAHFYYAMALLRQPFSPSPAAPQGATAADAELAERELRRVVQLQENFAPAYCLLALIEMRRGNLSEAQRLAERALALEPQSISNRLALAEIQSQKGNLAEAQQTLAVAAASARPEDKTRMAELLARMKVYDAQLESRRAGRKLRAEETDRPRWEKDKSDRGSKGRPVVRDTVPPAKQAYPRELPEITRETPEPARAPAQPPKYGFLRGKVAEVSCKPAQEMAEPAGIASLPAKRGKESNKLAVILSVEAKTRVFRFFKEDLSQVAMVSAPREGSVCESMGRTVSVNYLVRPESRGFGTGFDGELMSIEFAAREKPPVEAVSARTAGSPRRAAAPQPKPAVFRGTVEEVSCGRPMVFALRGKDRSGRVKVMRLRAGSATEFFATAAKGSPPANFNACESKGLIARATFRPLPPGNPYDGELTRVEFAWTQR